MGAEAWRLLPEDADGDETLVRLEAAYHEADGASLAAQAAYRRTLAVLAAVSTAIAVAFLLYDEAELHWMIVICGVLLAAARIIMARERRAGSHRAFIDARALAEALRVQAYLRYAGSPAAVDGLVSWSQADRCPEAIRRAAAMVVGAPSPSAHPIRDCWLEDQRRYHAAAARRTGGAAERSGAVVRSASAASICLYLAALAFELVAGGSLLPAAFAVDAAAWRAGLKIALGAASAATLFISSYYGALSVERMSEDHGRMERFYSWALARLDEEGQSVGLVEEIAREELAENGAWYSYRLEGAPELSL